MANGNTANLRYQTRWKAATKDAAGDPITAAWLQQTALWVAGLKCPDGSLLVHHNPESIDIQVNPQGAIAKGRATRAQITAHGTGALYTCSIYGSGWNAAPTETAQPLTVYNADADFVLPVGTRLWAAWNEFTATYEAAVEHNINALPEKPVPLANDMLGGYSVADDAHRKMRLETVSALTSWRYHDGKFQGQRRTFLALEPTTSATWEDMAATLTQQSVVIDTDYDTVPNQFRQQTKTITTLGATGATWTMVFTSATCTCATAG